MKLKLQLQCWFIVIGLLQALTYCLLTKPQQMAIQKTLDMSEDLTSRLVNEINEL